MSLPAMLLDAVHYWAPDAADSPRFNEFKGACMFALSQLLFPFRRGIGRTVTSKWMRRSIVGLPTVMASAFWGIDRSI